MPYDFADLPFLLALPVLLVVSAFFSGSETALFGLSAHQRYRLTRGGSLAGRLVGNMLADPRELLVTLMLGNMTVNVLYFVVSSVLLLRIDAGAVGPVWIAVATALPLLAIIVFGEVLPKLMANTAAVRWVRVAAIPLYGVHRVVTPIGAILSRWVVHPLGRLLAPQPAPDELDTSELEALLEMSQQRGVIGSDEQQLLREVLQLGRRKVRDVMVPRVDIEAIDAHAPPHQFRELIDRTRRTQYVAVDGNLDRPLGILYARQFLLAHRLEPNVNLRRLVRGVRFVPEMQRVDQLLDGFRKTGTKVAVVVDEYGGTAGLVTMKNVVEQMVGDLDADPTPGEAARAAVEPIGKRAWRVSGRLSVHDWAAMFAAHHINLPPRVATVGGLVMALLGRVPAAGEHVQLGNLDLEVERMDGGRVESAILRLMRLRENRGVSGRSTGGEA